MAIADTKKIKTLLDSSVSGWNIEKSTGISRNTIAEMRHGRRQIENVRLETAIKLTEFADDKLGDHHADS